MNSQNAKLINLDETNKHTDSKLPECGVQALSGYCRCRLKCVNLQSNNPAIMIDRHSSYRPTDSMRDLLRDNNLLLFAISRFGIRFGFGDASVKDTCEQNGVDTATFLAVANLLSGREHESYPAAMPSLISYLKATHTYYLDTALPSLRHKVISSINTADSNDVSMLIVKMFDDYVAELRDHLDEENDSLFPYIMGMLEGRVDREFDVRSFSTDHSPVTEKLQDLKDIFIYHYPTGHSALLGAVLFDIINLERDLMTHFEIENHLLLPAAVELDDSLRQASASAPRQEQPIELLGEREKEILKHIALGASNKEIADKLCLSVHTVATHRKNIISKLQIHSAAGLTIFAILHNIIDISDVEQR